jgi:hypothetical protein
MKFSTQFRTLLCLATGLTIASSAWGQAGLFNNRGAVVYINTGAVVRVLGTVTNSKIDADMTNMGDFIIDKNFGSKYA